MFNAKFFHVTMVFFSALVLFSSCAKEKPSQPKEDQRVQAIDERANDGDAKKHWLQEYHSRKEKESNEQQVKAVEEYRKKPEGLSLF